jgi:hypothetical protein
MNEFMLTHTDGRERLQELIKEAEQERLARKVAQAQRKGQSLSRVRTLLVKTVSSITG